MDASAPPDRGGPVTQSSLGLGQSTSESSTDWQAGAGVVDEPETPSGHRCVRTSDQTGFIGSGEEKMGRSQGGGSEGGEGGGARHRQTGRGAAAGSSTNVRSGLASLAPTTRTSTSTASAHTPTAGRITRAMAQTSKYLTHLAREPASGMHHVREHVHKNARHHP